MHKTVEAIQAWRRAHQGAFPARLSDLVNGGYLPQNGAICPAVLAENRTADPSHALASSRGSGGDPNTTYEYELSAKVLKSGFEARWLPHNTSYTRQDLKEELLRRPLSEQVPWLRCHSHRIGAPPEFNGDSWRNATGSGDVYWSGLLWEERWYSDIPYCCREANVLFGLKGPPFHSGRAPAIPEAMDLRPWVCSFGDHPWWWSYPLFDDPPNTQRAATLKAFFRQSPGRVALIDGTKWWIDGLSQVQGQISPNETNMYRQSCAHAFIWERTGLAVSRKMRRASWLQGTVWAASANDITGYLVWHYANGQTERVPITYGKTTARFWGELDQISKEHNFPEPVWKHHESAEEVGKERWLRLYKQTWDNPHPELTVTTLDFVSNRESPAAPFIVAINVYP